MKKIHFLALCVSCLLATNVSAGSHDYGCQKKLFNLEKQLDYAYRYNNPHRARALERAMERVRNSCSRVAMGDSTYYDGYSGASYRYGQRDYFSLKKKIAKAELELAEAQMKGDPRKIAKRKGELDLLKEEFQFSERDVRENAPN